MTCVMGMLFTKIISVRNAIGAKLVGQPAGTAQYPKSYVQEWE